MVWSVHIQKQASEDCCHRIWMCFLRERLSCSGSTGVPTKWTWCHPPPLLSSIYLTGQLMTRIWPKAAAQSWASLPPAPWETLTNFHWIKKVTKGAAEEPSSPFLGGQTQSHMCHVASYIWRWLWSLYHHLICCGDLSHWSSYKSP